MQFRHVLLGTAVAVVVSVGAAQASTGWYMSLGAGANWVQDSDYKVKVPGPGTIITGTTDFDGGYVVAGAVGYDWGHWRAEFELAYRNNDVDCATASGRGTCFTVPGA